jgi:hypothetical protein
VVGDGEGGKPEFVGLLHQLVQTTGAIEQGILGVQVQMNKISVRHDGNLARAKEETKLQSVGRCPREVFTYLKLRLNFCGVQPIPKSGSGLRGKLDEAGQIIAPAVSPRPTPER